MEPVGYNAAEKQYVENNFFRNSLLYDSEFF